MAVSAIHPGEHLTEELKELDMSSKYLQTASPKSSTAGAPSPATRPCA